MYLSTNVNCFAKLNVLLEGNGINITHNTYMPNGFCPCAHFAERHNEIAAMLQPTASSTMSHRRHVTTTCISRPSQMGSRRHMFTATTTRQKIGLSPPRREYLKTVATWVIPMIQFILVEIVSVL